jgi:hypothetical protein
MPRFTPWSFGAPPETPDSDSLLEEVLRPSLRQAFPLPASQSGEDPRFRRLLEALAQRTVDAPLDRSLRPVP